MIDTVMVKWLPASLLIAIVLAALPGPNAGRCAATMTARLLGCSDAALAPGGIPVSSNSAPGCCPKPDPKPAPVASCCASGQPAAAPSSCAGDAAQTCGSGGSASSADCSACLVVCGALCDESYSWALLGLASDGLSHAAPGAALLAKSEWLPRPASDVPPPALAADWLTVDRPRRQARLCVWTV